MLETHVGGKSASPYSKRGLIWDNGMAAGFKGLTPTSGPAGP